MRRGELYRAIPGAQEDPRQFRIYLVVSRQRFIDSRYRTVACVPVYSRKRGLTSEVIPGPQRGLKHPSVARCDEITSISRRQLTRYIGQLQDADLPALDAALVAALEIQHINPLP